MPENRAVVLGGGIGGLTAAAALHRRGWQVTVLERAAALEPVGAGISLAPNAQRALDVIGLGDAVRARTAWPGAGGLRTPSGRWLARTRNEAAAARYGGPLVLLTRTELVEMLARTLPADTVRTGRQARLADSGARDRPAVVHTEHEQLTAELVVVADGIHSGARRMLFPRHPQPAYAGCTTWRFVTDAPRVSFAPHETWGRGALWGTQPLPDGRVYAYAAAAVSPSQSAPEGERAELARRFGSWHAPVPQLIEAVDPAAVLRNDVYEASVPLPAYHRGRVALLGDAAHAMTPHLGQGGNQAIEDAVVLAHHAPPGAADLPGYTLARLRRTTEVVRRSRQAGRIATLGSAPGCLLRDLTVAVLDRAAPGLALRALDGIADWSPPTS
jgi:2-polyprenyl-6-methoxyphenol hydroxylase-like FAD-dependent oxidoreductase